jgi:hypoxanthine phosphoribosyltransferase
MDDAGAPTADRGAPAPTEDPLLGETIVAEEALADRIAELGAQITADYEGRSLLLVGVLKGAFMFMADLSRAIDRPIEVDFMAVSSYGSATKTSGIVRIVKDLDLDLKDRDVLVVEDIVDSGLTLKYLLKNLWAREPASLEVCALLRKDCAAPMERPLRYVGFEIPNDFVVGYGLDAGEQYRHLRSIRRYIET